MTPEEQKQLRTLTQTVHMILDTYGQSGMMPEWLFRWLHPRGQQVKLLKQSLLGLAKSISHTTSFIDVQNELIHLLDNKRYFYSVHTVSHRLRTLVQEAMLACIIFTHEDVKLYHEMIEQQQDISGYLGHFKNQKALQEYRDYFANRHSIYGVDASEISADELTMYARGALINGMLIQRFGLRQVLQTNMKRIKIELQTLIRKRIEKGYLTLTKTESYIDKINLLLHHIKTDNTEFNEASLVQQARYIVENITSTAGVKQLGPALYLEHAKLITACYWVDETLMQARARVDVELPSSS